jgi:hypothetical protein
MPYKLDNVESAERLSIKIAAFFVLSLVSILLIAFVLSYEMQSSVYNFLYPSEDVIARMNNDPFLSVLGTISIFIVGSGVFLFIVIFLHYLLKIIIFRILVRHR